MARARLRTMAFAGLVFLPLSVIPLSDPAPEDHHRSLGDRGTAASFDLRLERSFGLRGDRSFRLGLDLDGELQELAGWVGANRDFTTGLALSEAVREHPDSFRVFREIHDADSRRERVAGLPFGIEIAEAAERHDLDPLLVAAVVEVESSFRPEVGSHKGAIGLMQLLPSTAGKSRRQLQNPTVNLDAGSRYLDYLIDRFDEDLVLSLAAYNAGPTVVRRIGDVPPYPETQRYVEKVLGRYVEHHRALWRSSGSDQELVRLLGRGGKMRAI